MFNEREIKDRAIMMAIRTGEMPNLDVIWARQKADGYTVCFGQGVNCPRQKCIWRRQCLALSYFAAEESPVMTPRGENFDAEVKRERLIA
jgi:hypothetical protein